MGPILKILVRERSNSTSGRTWKRMNTKYKMITSICWTIWPRQTCATRRGRPNNSLILKTVHNSHDFCVFVLFDRDLQFFVYFFVVFGNSWLALQINICLYILDFRHSQTNIAKVFVAQQFQKQRCRNIWPMPCSRAMLLELVVLQHWQRLLLASGCCWLLMLAAAGCSCWLMLADVFRARTRVHAHATHFVGL